MEEETIVLETVDSRWWSNLSEQSFQSSFRMCCETFVELQAEIDLLEDISDPETNVNLLICLWVLGNTNDLEDVAGIFDVTGDVYETVEEYLGKIIKLSGTYIQWPTVSEAEEIEKMFLLKYSFPGIFGVLGSLHVVVNVNNASNKDVYFNIQAQKHTVVLQVVCDSNLLIRDASAGLPGGSSIESIFKLSNLHKKLTDENSYIVKKRKHLLGGTEHPHLPTLLTPYKIQANMIEKHVKYNNLHASVMHIVEETFRFMENRFPRLTSMDVFPPTFASLVINAACVLHNFTRIRNDNCDLYE